MKLKDLLSALPEYDSVRDKALEIEAEIVDICIDSRQLKPNSVFIALHGTKVDSHQFLAEVANKNPLAIVVQDTKNIPASYTGVCLKVENTREALDLLASRWKGDPSQSLVCIGVTGTNGKTSTTYMLEHILNVTGVPTGVIGTIDHHFKDKKWATQLTTPGPIELQSRLEEFRECGAKAVAMEVSSIALHQNRLDSIHFNTVIFTNLTQDHLDYHTSLEDYFVAKQKLFVDLIAASKKNPKFAIVNLDNDWAKKLLVDSSAEVWSYGSTEDVDFRWQIDSADFSSTKYTVSTAWGQVSGVLPMCGAYNVQNAVGVMAAVASLGIPLDVSIHIMNSFPGVPGRLQPVPNSKNIHVLVDYAHSPDALDNVLEALQKVRDTNKLQNKIITVFGCGGDRDKVKRPMMGRIAEANSDEVIVTSDNPRNEKPEQIIQEILTGFIKTKPQVFVNRKEAIAQAIAMAKSGDVVLIAGKGHENYQQIGDEKIPFSDYEIAKGILG